MVDQARRTSGFTLLELLIVLSMLGILLSVAAVAGSRWRERTQMNNFMSELAYDINVTRTKTLSTGQLRRVRLINSKQYSIEQKGTGTTWNTLKTNTAPKNLLSLAPGSAWTFEFNTRGSMEATTQAGAVTTNSVIEGNLSGKTTQIRITALGLARRE
jgi:prepilin-type N-terminal cleavage/methylation domain-containing protein